MFIDPATGRISGGASKRTRTEYRTIKEQKAANYTDLYRVWPDNCRFFHQMLHQPPLGKGHRLAIADDDMVQYPDIHQPQRLHQPIGDLPISL